MKRKRVRTVAKNRTSPFVWALLVLLPVSLVLCDIYYNALRYLLGFLLRPLRWSAIAAILYSFYVFLVWVFGFVVEGESEGYYWINWKCHVLALSCFLWVVCVLVKSPVVILFFKVTLLSP